MQSDVKFIDTPIQGRLLEVSLTTDINETLEVIHDKDFIKKQLTHLIAEKLLEKQLLSFTRIDDPVYEKTTFYARGFLVSDDKIKLIRTLAK